MKRTQFWSFVLVSAVAPAAAHASSISVGSNLVSAVPHLLVVAQDSQLEKLPAENVDGSKVNSKTQDQAAAIIKEFKAQESTDLMGAASVALEKFETLHQTDNLNLSVMTWIGYLSSVTGNHARAIEVLESIRGKSANADVNVMNLKNLAGSLYATQAYGKAAEAFTALDLAAPGNATTLSLLGSCYVLSKDYEKAIDPLNRALDLLGDDMDSRRNVLVDLAISYHRTGRTKEAMGVFDTLRGDSELTAVQLGWMGYVYLQNKAYDSAIDSLERSLALDGTNEVVVNNLANAYLSRGKSGDEAKAVALYEKLAGMQSGNAVADYNIGSLYLNRGDFAKAKPFLVRAARSNDPYALNNLGRACEGLKEDKEAASNYAKASDLRPDVDTFASNAGFAYMRLNQPASAIPYLERANKLNGNAEIRVNLATAYTNTGKHDEAMVIWMSPEVREMKKNDANYWFNVARAHDQAGQTAEAEAAYRQSLSIDSNNAAVVNNLGVLLWNKGEYEGALDCFKRQSALDPKNVEATLNVASAHVKLGQLNEAVEIWRGVVRSNPKRMDVRLDLADGLWNLGDTPGARFHYAYVNKEQPNNARALNGLGMWALLQTQHDEAASLFRQSLNNDRKFVPAYQNLAIVLERQNKVSEAIKVLEAALAVDKDNDGVQQQLSRLKSR
ncbi:MAG: tetratricopeptide repeat protein [Fimbriimonadaceae bacterium]|nr:MAG: tetratricopeptide repeat protein [Fimbriimonadaceae bacterium]